MMAYFNLVLAWVFVTVTAGVTANETCHTWVLNKSSKDILVTTSYVNFSGHSAFIKRKIPAHGGKDSDEYAAPYGLCQSIGSQTGFYKVNVEVQEATAKNHNSFTVLPDTSVLALDNPTNGGVDFFKSVFGYLDQKSGPLLCTIYNN